LLVYILFSFVNEGLPLLACFSDLWVQTSPPHQKVLSGSNDQFIDSAVAAKFKQYKKYVLYEKYVEDDLND
jgi:hypothetical protein